MEKEFGKMSGCLILIHVNDFMQDVECFGAAFGGTTVQIFTIQHL